MSIINYEKIIRFKYKNVQNIIYITFFWMNLSSIRWNSGQSKTGKKSKNISYVFTFYFFTFPKRQKKCCYMAGGKGEKV